MHRFWRNASLRETLADHLQQDDYFRLVPLLGVNKTLRTLAEKRLLAVYRDTGVYRSGTRAGQINGEGFLRSVFLFLSFNHFLLTLNICRIEQGEWAHPDGGPVSARNDPRRLFTTQAKSWKDPQLSLSLVNYNKKTTICTFEPATQVKHLDFHIPVDKRTGVPENDCCDSFPTVFIGGAATWFHPASPTNPKRFAGLELAAKPDRHPSREPLIPMIQPYVYGKRGGNLATKAYKCSNGWEANFTTKRQKVKRMFQDGQEWIHVKLFVESIKVPLVQLFIPPTTSKSDMDFCTEDTADEDKFTLDEWESNFYDFAR